MKLEGQSAPLGYGIVTIENAGPNDVSYSGEKFDKDGNNIGDFRSELGKVLGRTLIYMYEASGAGNPVSNRGRGDVQFVGRNTFSGSFYDIEHQRWHKVEGRRLQDSEVTDARSQQPAAIRSLIQKHFGVVAEAGT